MNAFATTLWIALGGALGTVARYWIAIWALPVSRSLPWGTIGINIAGSFLIGFVGADVGKRAAAAAGNGAAVRHGRVPRRLYHLLVI
jgi:fluoride ion exporter CrcB/FEX